MPTILFYFDFVSPYVYIAFHQLPKVLGGLAWQMQYRPVVLDVFFKEHHAASPSAIAAKQAWRLRHAQWLAKQSGLPFVAPARDPFNDAAWSQMALASSPHGQPNRQVCETFFNAIWQYGGDPDDPAVQQQAWLDATALLPSVRDVKDLKIRQEQAELSQAAQAHGVFKVPSLVLIPETSEHGSLQVFCGMEGLSMLREAVLTRQFFDGAEQS